MGVCLAHLSYHHSDSDVATEATGQLVFTPAKIQNVNLA